MSYKYRRGVDVVRVCARRADPHCLYMVSGVDTTIND